MATRKSNRLAAKERLRNGAGEVASEGDDRGIGRRASVGGALGLTPAGPRGRNLAMAKAAGAAEAAAARLDELNANQQEARTRTKRKSSKARKAARKKQAAEAARAEGHAWYRAESRESLALLQKTQKYFEEASDEEKNETGMQDVPNEPEAGNDGAGDGPMTKEPNEGAAEGWANESVIRTPEPSKTHT